MIQNLLCYNSDHLCGTAIQFLMLSLYSIRLSICITTCRSFALSTWVLFILLMQSVNNTQFFKVTCLFTSSAFLAAGSTPGSVIVMVPFKSIHASLLSQRPDQHCSLEIELTMFVVCFTCLFIHLNPAFVLNLYKQLFVLSSKSMIF